jgi:hypothetical protein
MHDESLSQDNLSAAAVERLDQRLIRALEAAPEVRIPVDFAARIAGQVPATRPVSLTPTYYGYTAMLIGMLIALVAMVAVALHTAGRSTFGLPESLLFALFLALAVWFGGWRHSLR